MSDAEKDLMEVKHLDFDAPLLSVRRFTPVMSSSASSFSSRAWEERAPAAGKPPPRRCSLPFYMSESRSGAVRNPGAIPFLWEQTPGQPKENAGSVAARPLDQSPVAPKPPPGRVLTEKESDGLSSTGAAKLNAVLSASDGGMVESAGNCKNGVTKAGEDGGGPPVSVDWCDSDEALSDTLSRTESFSMNCSSSGSPNATQHSGCFLTDPEVRDFMMGRFLPAAQAMAAGLPPCTWRKQPASLTRRPTRPAAKTDEGNCIRLLPPPYQRRPNCSGEDEEEEDLGDAAHLSSKSFGLIPPCLRSSFALLNPVRGMVIRSRLPQRSGRNHNPWIETSHHASLGLAEEENSWEAVYKYKLGHGISTPEEERSKLTSESNRLTYWSDSQTYDGSSSYLRSTGGGISPCRNGTPRSSFHEEKGFLGVPKKESRSNKTDVFDSVEKDGKNYWAITPCTTINRTRYAYSVHMSETVNSKLSSANALAGTGRIMNFADKDSEAGVDSQKMEHSFVLSETDAVQPKFFELADPGLSSFSGRSSHEEMDGNYFKDHGISDDDSLPSKVEDQAKNGANLSQSLFPPPLPKSPSDSWLWRTLPSVSSKNPSPQSLLAIQFQPRKHSSRAFSTDPK